jgi:hypothetical protein
MDFNIAPTKILRVADHACCYFTAFFTRRISLRLPDGISTEHAISDILACGKLTQVLTNSFSSDYSQYI